MKTSKLYLLCAATLTAAVMSASAMENRTATEHVATMRLLEMPGGIPYLTTDTASVEFQQAIRFLYDYMPLPDRLDYPREFFIENIVVSLRGRQELPWGDIVPEREFKHFVLPVRVNNENLDRHRMIFYNELKPRIQDKSMYDAILEVNRWCREHVTYQPSDPRTHSPLASVGSAIGRCGEESTFLVAALRSVGIPARQVYTPRWAHTDDNHAWVEAWANGKWYFLGACEPESVLNLGWFNAPASRGMLMTTRVMGEYDGPEEVLVAEKDYVIINVTEHYAATNPLTVKVVDAKGNAVEDATVDFRLYNYAEFYPIASKKTDISGTASLIRGKGDLLIWVSKKGKYNAALCKGDLNEITISIDDTISFPLELNIVPPKGNTKLPVVTAEQRAENDRSNARADSIRLSYTGTFATENFAIKLANDLSLPYDKLYDILKKSRGNHTTVTEFLQTTPQHSRPTALHMLTSLTEKDLTDISLYTLRDAFDNSLSHTMDDFETRYILSPRAEYEFVTPQRFLLQNELKHMGTDTICVSAYDWARLIENNIDCNQTWEPATVRISPLSVLKSGKADIASRNLLFVDGARALGFAARIDPVTSKAQYATPNRCWVDAFPEKNVDSSAKKGILKLSYDTDKNIVTEPEYYTHFSLQRIANGRPQLLEFPEGTTLDTFNKGVELDGGDYILVSGQRMADGTVLSRTDFFRLAPASALEIPLEIRHDDQGVQVIGNFNSENLYFDKKTNTEKSLLSTTGRGYYVIGLVRPAHEPCNHVLRDIAKLGDELVKENCKIILLTRNENDLTNLDKNIVTSLPENVVWGIDIKGNIEREIIENMHLSEESLPIVLIADTFNRVVFVSHGYNIAVGQQLHDTLRKLNKQP